MKKEGDLITGIKGLAWMSSSVVVDYIINFVTTYVLARLLTPGDYGEVAAIGVLTGLADMLWQMGVGPALVQKNDLSDKDISTGFTLNILFGLTAFLIVNLFAGLWVNIFSITSITMLRVYSLVFILNCVIATPHALMQKKCKFKLMSSINILSTVFYGVVAVILAKLGFGPWTLVYATILKFIFKGIITCIKERVPFRLYIDKRSAKEILFFGSGHTVARIFNYIANNGDNFVVNKMLNKVALGSYTKAHSLIGYPATLIGGTIDSVLFPILSKNQDNREKLSRSFLMGTGLIAILTFPVAVAMYFCADSLILFYLGDNWGMVASCLRIMLIALFFRIAYKVCDTVIIAIGKVYQRSAIQIIYSVLIVGGAYIGSKNGINGVALSVAIAFTANYLFMTALSIYYLKTSVWEYLKTLIGPIVYSVITVLICIVASPWVGKIGNSFFSCVAWVIVAFVPYGAMFMLTRKFVVSKDINDALNTVIGRFIKKSI